MVPRTEEVWQDVKARPELCGWSCSAHALVHGCTHSRHCRMGTWLLLHSNFSLSQNSSLLLTSCTRPAGSVTSVNLLKAGRSMDTNSWKRQICASAELMDAVELNQAWEQAKLHTKLQLFHVFLKCARGNSQVWF